ncbi:hypothetical protein GCM10010840_27640 [Deinococcus aerolatus]|uniref:Bacterial transcriptional activator domain-containing protein n=2 Tax=Deinococcus aerolatus TaxID=522487 RepID=A0ABQ2GDC1_9DEIO|nr:hypothetical protein GCM10010840_27640 [Deinococcus aerolatus]
MPTVTHTDGTVIPLDRKTAGVLAVLACTGRSSRSRLAGLLWPDSRESLARNSLVQLMRRWRRTVGENLVEGGDTVSLTGAVSVDATEVFDAYLAGQDEALGALQGALLEPYAYSDLPEFDEWLRGERDRWHEARRGALTRLCDRDTDRAAYNDALGWAERLLALTPASEEAFLRVMKLQYLLGDRDRALATYHRCEAALRREHHVAPLPATLALARLVQESRTISRPAPPPIPAMPPAVRCPPVLVGREREWALMNDAWSRGLSIVVSGEPGIGKTRLMREFIASKGAWFHLDGRPGDTTVPYGTYARVWRALLRARPDIDLPGWAREQLALFLPELSPAQTPDAATPDQEGLAHAMDELALRACQGMAGVVADDIQYYDAASMELSSAIAVRYAPFTVQGGIVPLLTAHRKGELPAYVEASLRRLVAVGHGIWIDLQPLDDTAVTRVLASLDLPLSGGDVARLTRSSNGNPLFLLEAVKHLIEHAPGGPAPALPEKVHGVIGERLRRLSPKALLLAQAACVLQTDVDLDLVTTMLDAPLLDMLPAWQELEGAQILQQGRFSHDLVYESVRAGMSKSVRQALHRRAARALEREGEEPARIARHWTEGGDARRAVPALQAAARSAVAAQRYAEAAEALEQAAATLEATGEPHQAFDIRRTLAAEVLWPGGAHARLAACLHRLAQTARTPELHASVERLKNELTSTLA